MANKSTGSAAKTSQGTVLVTVDPADLDSLATNARKTLKAIVERYTTLTRLGHDLGRSMQWVWRIVFSSKNFPVEKATEVLRALGVPLRFYFAEVTKDEPPVRPAFVLNFFAGWTPDWVTETIRSFSFMTHFNAMNRGVIDLKDVFFFASLIALFLFANAIVVDLKKAG